MNPGRLKLDLTARGVRLSPDAAARDDLLAGWPRQNGADRKLELLLPGDLWVSAPIRESGEGDLFTLSIDGEIHTLARGDEERTEVRVVPAPSYYAKRTSKGTPMSDVARVHGGCLVISPASTCGLAIWDHTCAFCRGAASVAESRAPIPPNEVVEVVREAFAEGVAEFVYFNHGHEPGEDAGIAFLEPYVRAVKRHFDTLVAVQVHPPRTNAWIDQTYAMGVDALSYAVEIHDPARLEQECPGRCREIGRDRYYDALRHAATILPSGTVWTDLVVGLEPVESTRAAIDMLTAMNVLPVLSLAPGRSLSTEDLVPLFTHLFQKVRDAKINMGWVRDLSFAMTPLEARFFAGDDARMAVAMQSFYRTRVGSLAARNLSRLRRRLRVRRVGDSFDSSHL